MGDSPSHDKRSVYYTPVLRPLLNVASTTGAVAHKKASNATFLLRSRKHRRPVELPTQSALNVTELNNMTPDMTASEAGCSGMYRQRNSSRRTIAVNRVTPRQGDSHTGVSGDAGAVHAPSHFAPNLGVWKIVGRPPPRLRVVIPEVVVLRRCADHGNVRRCRLRK